MTNQLNENGYQVGGAYPDGRVVITHQYDDSFRRELTLSTLARAAGKLGESDGSATYMRLFAEARRILLRRGYRTEVTETTVAVTKTPGRLARETK
jgi:hypothetical protein